MHAVWYANVAANVAERNPTMTPEEIKESELRAYGKRITFHTRHHWILTWLEELPGKSLASKVWTIVDAAYRADYTARGRAAMTRYLSLLETFDYDSPDPQQEILRDMLTALSNACEYFGRAGKGDDEERARDLLRSIVYQQYKRAA
jgi:hypothetical protein